MEIQIKKGRMLRATLCEIERGLFHVTYCWDDVALGKHHLPPYQLGTCASDAMRRIEREAQECGYEAIVWEAEPAVPQLAAGRDHSAGVLIRGRRARALI